MNQYVTGAMIKRLRENKNLTQLQLAEIINVSDKTVSKWETGRGYPDVSLIEELAKALEVSVIELFSGESIINTNRSLNMNRMKFYVCPICANVAQSIGEAVVSCCGIVLPPLEAEDLDESHQMKIESVEDEYFVSISHEMSKSHYISFIAAVKDDGCEIKKLYPESNAEARFKINRTKQLYFFCNKDGLYKTRIH